MSYPAHRLYLGDVTPDALGRIMDAVRAEHRSDDLAWYSLDRASIPERDHPRNPGHRWTEIAGDE